MQILSCQYVKTRDPRLRDALILYHQKLVHYVASRFLGGGETLEDLIQVGTIGLISALDRFDPTREVQFSTFAMPTIIGEIKRHFRDRTWQVKVPRWLQEMSVSARKAERTLAARLGRSPTIREVAEQLGATEDDALEALEIAQIVNTLSLDTRLDPHAESEGATLMDVVGRLDSALHDIDAHADLRRAMDLLEERERCVIRMRFFEEQSQAGIARQLGLSQMHISRLQQRALHRLRALLADEPDPYRRPKRPRRA